jgi:hypothetical protein
METFTKRIVNEIASRFKKGTFSSFIAKDPAFQKIVVENLFILVDTIEAFMETESSLLAE